MNWGVKVIVDPRAEVECEIRETLKRVGRVRGRGAGDGR